MNSVYYDFAVLGNKASVVEESRYRDARNIIYRCSNSNKPLISELIEEINNSNEFASVDDFWKFICDHAVEKDSYQTDIHGLLRELDDTHRKILQLEALIAPSLIKFGISGDTGLDPQPLLPISSEKTQLSQDGYSEETYALIPDGGDNDSVEERHEREDEYYQYGS